MLINGYKSWVNKCVYFDNVFTVYRCALRSCAFLGNRQTVKQDLPDGCWFGLLFVEALLSHFLGHTGPWHTGPSMAQLRILVQKDLSWLKLIQVSRREWRGREEEWQRECWRRCSIYILWSAGIILNSWDLNNKLAFFAVIVEGLKDVRARLVLKLGTSENEWYTTVACGLLLR